MLFMLLCILVLCCVRHEAYTTLGQTFSSDEVISPATDESTEAISASIGTNDFTTEARENKPEQNTVSYKNPTGSPGIESTVEDQNMTLNATEGDLNSSVTSTPDRNGSLTESGEENNEEDKGGNETVLVFGPEESDEVNRTRGNFSEYDDYSNSTFYEYYDDSEYDDNYTDTNSNETIDVIFRKSFHRQVPLEAVAFLGAVGAFLLLLVIFFLYLNKSLCFSECGGFPCIDRPPKKDKTFNKLDHGSVGLGLTDKDKTGLLEGTAYQYDEDTSSDSDDEVLKHYQSSLASQGQRGSIRSSVRSIKSARSRKSEKSVKEKMSPDQQVEDAASLAEKGQQSGDGSSPGSEEEEDSQHGAAEELSPDAQPSIKTESNPELDDQHTYENKAFLTERSASLFGSEQGLTATDRTMSNDEHLFDVSDLQGEPPLISKCGSLEVSFKYEAKRGKMTVTIHQAREIPAKDRGGASNVQVRMMLLPTKKQKFKTKVKVGDSPNFEESFVFSKIFPDDVHGMGIRVRLYGLERMRRERMIGESIVGFASLNLDEETTHWMVLEPRSNLSHGESGFDVSSLSRSDSASSTQSLQHGGMPELLIGLAYNETTGRLSVEVIKGSNFRNMAMNRAPDTYVKLTLMSPTGQELQRCKTSVRRGQPNPLFKETFMFQVALFQLPEVTVMVSVYNKKSMKKKEMIGWFSLGMNCSGEEEGSHWSDMRESKGEQVCRWHVLLES